MLWLIASAALAVFVFLAFYYAESRRALLATLGVIGILAAAAAFFITVETRQSAEVLPNARSIPPSEAAIPEAKLAKEYGRWAVSGTLTNRSDARITALSLHVTIRDCADLDECKTVGDTMATAYGLDVPPGESRPFDMLLYLPDLKPPKEMKWDYEIVALRAGR